MELSEQLVDTWQIHNRINLFLLENIPEEALAAAPTPKGRNIVFQLAHMHNVRIDWMQKAAAHLTKFSLKGDPPNKTQLQEALQASGEAIAAFLRNGLDKGRISGFKPHPAAFLGYLISHESYHRGEIGLILGQAGYKLNNSVAYGMWEWGER